MTRILVVDTSKKNQQERLKKRAHFTRHEIESIIKSQIDRKTRLTQADDIIKNSSTIQALKQQVKKLHEKYNASQR